MTFLALICLVFAEQINYFSYASQPGHVRTTSLRRCFKVLTSFLTSCAN